MVCALTGEPGSFMAFRPLQEQLSLCGTPERNLLQSICRLAPNDGSLENGLRKFLRACFSLGRIIRQGESVSRRLGLPLPLSVELGQEVFHISVAFLGNFVGSLGVHQVFEQQ